MKAKKEELEEILKETEKEEALLAKKSKEFEVKIEEDLFQSYKKIRKKC